MVLRDIICGPVLKAFVGHFFFQGAGDKDKGGAGTLLVCNRQSCDPAELGEGIVCQDKIKTAFFKCTDIVITRYDPHHIIGDTSLCQPCSDKLCVSLTISHV